MKRHPFAPPSPAPGVSPSRHEATFGCSRKTGTPTPDSVRVSGSWYLDQENPGIQPLTGHIFRSLGLAYFTLDNFDTKIIEGIFVSMRGFSGAYREPGGCVNRLWGKFLE